VDIYQKEVIDHYKHPRNFGRIKSNSKSTYAENPSCGDSIRIDAVIKNGKIKDIKFSGEGCAIAIASASMLTQRVRNMEVVEIADIDFDHVKDMLGVEIHQGRKRCAMLALNTLKKLILKELKK